MLRCFRYLERVQSCCSPYNRRPCHFEAAGEKWAAPKAQREQILRLTPQDDTPFAVALLLVDTIPGIAIRPSRGAVPHPLLHPKVGI